MSTTSAIPTSSPETNLQRIQRKVAEQLAVKFIPAFLEKSIKHHCRKGIRTKCECSFCSAKKLGTSQIGNWHYLKLQNNLELKENFHAQHAHWEEIDLMWRTTIQRRREEQRKVLRQKLLSLQQDVL